MTDEIICPVCGHTENVHTSMGCQIGICDCVFSLEFIIIDGQSARLAALTLAVGEGREREKKLREALEVAEKELNDANVGKFSFALQEVRTALVETAPATEAE